MKVTLPKNAYKDPTPSWELLKPNFKLIQRHYVALMYLLVLPALLYLFGSLLVGNRFLTHFDHLTSREIIGYAITLIAVLWNIINLGPTITLQLNATSGAAPELIGSYYRQGLPYTWRLIGASIVYALSVIVGLALLIIPGIIMFRRYYLVTYYIVDKKLPIRQALRQSAADSKVASGPVWGVIGVQMVFVISAGIVQSIPGIGLVLGELLAYTTIFIAALRYKEIVGIGD